MKKDKMLGIFLEGVHNTNESGGAKLTIIFKDFIKF